MPGMTEMTVAGKGDKKLNLGSGMRPIEGFVNLDWSSQGNPDVVHDLNAFPYPFPDNSFDFVEMSHILEHLDRPFFVMREVYRILKPGGVVHISVPHFSRGFTHAEHAHGFDVSFPYYLDARYDFSGYAGCDFRHISTRLQWMAFFHLLEKIGYGRATIGLLKSLNAVISWLANLSPAFTSRFWCYYVGGFEQIEFYLEAKK